MFFDYISNIIYYLIFASVAGIFAPAGKYRKFVSLVLGFVMLLLIIQPLAGIFGDVPVTDWFASAMPVPAMHAGDESAYAEMWDNHLRSSFESQLEAQLSRMLSSNGFVLHRADFSYSADFSRITAVRVSVSEKDEPEQGRIPFIRIVPPEIRPVQIGEVAEEISPQVQTVRNLISEFYNLAAQHIYVEVN